MYRIDNVSSEKILIQFINLFTDWGTWLQILHFAESWLGWSFGMVRWPLHHNNNLTDTCPLDRSYQANSSNSCLWMPSFWVTVMTLLETCWYNLSILNKQKVYEDWAGKQTSLVNKWLQALPPFPTPVCFCFIFIFVLSQFCWPDYLGAWNRLASHADILRGSLRVPAPLTCNKPLRMFTWEARNGYCSEGMVFRQARA